MRRGAENAWPEIAGLGSECMSENAGTNCTTGKCVTESAGPENVGPHALDLNVFVSIRPQTNTQLCW